MKRETIEEPILDRLEKEFLIVDRLDEIVGCFMLKPFSLIDCVNAFPAVLGFPWWNPMRA